jgi:hypothetical protein
MQDQGDFKVISIDTIIIPECCREGWDSCPHVVKRTKATKKNIAL